MDREIAIWKRLRDTPGATEQADEGRGTYELKGPLGEVISPTGAGPKIRGDVNPPRFAGMAPVRLDMPADDRWVSAKDFSGPLAALSRVRASALLSPSWMPTAMGARPLPACRGRRATGRL
jgi:hypothetical protein